MGKIHCFDGDKGGVGKSFISTVFIQYYLDKNQPFKPVEADRYNPDVASRYADLPFYHAVFSEDERTSAKKEEENPDRILEFAIEKDVIISLPAQIGLPLNRWLDTAVLTASEVGVQIIRWFVTSGTYESLDLFQRAINWHGRNMPFVLVKNWGLCEDWSQLDEDRDLQNLIRQFGVKILDFPKLDWKEANLMQRKNLSFAKAREHEDFHLMQRTRIKAFLKQAYDAFEAAGFDTPEAVVEIKRAPEADPWLGDGTEKKGVFGT